MYVHTHLWWLQMLPGYTLQWGLPDSRHSTSSDEDLSLFHPPPLRHTHHTTPPPSTDASSELDK